MSIDDECYFYADFRDLSCCLELYKEKLNLGPQCLEARVFKWDTIPSEPIVCN